MANPHLGVKGEFEIDVPKQFSWLHRQFEEYYHSVLAKQEYYKDGKSRKLRYSGAGRSNRL